MLVNGSASDGATAGKRNLRALILSKKCTNEVIGCADLAHMLIFHGHCVDIPSIDPYCVPVGPLHLSAQVPDRIQQCVDIAYIRQVLDHHILIGHDGRRQDPQSRIFCSADGHVSHQGVAALHNILFHSAPLYPLYRLPEAPESGLISIIPANTLICLYFD